MAFLTITDQKDHGSLGQHFWVCELQSMHGEWVKELYSTLGYSKADRNRKGRNIQGCGPSGLTSESVWIHIILQNLWQIGKASLWAPTASLWFEPWGITAVSIVSQFTVIGTDKTHWVSSSSQLRISPALRRLSCFQQWGFRRFPARLLDRAAHPLSGNPLVFNLKFPFASSFPCQLPLQSALSKSFTIYIFQLIRHN